jgi:hypothetical protein
MAITGVVFALFLSGHQESLETHIGWVNFIVHTLLPIVLVADWLLDPPRHRLPLWVGAAWLCYPAAWFVKHARARRERRLVAVPVRRRLASRLRRRVPPRRLPPRRLRRRRAGVHADR